MHHVPVNVLQMENRVKQANTTPSVRHGDFLPLRDCDPDVNPAPLSQEKHTGGSAQCDMDLF